MTTKAQRKQYQEVAVSINGHRSTEHGAARAAAQHYGELALQAIGYALTDSHPKRHAMLANGARLYARQAAKAAMFAIGYTDTLSTKKGNN
jgi:hypothetical protein